MPRRKHIAFHPPQLAPRPMFPAVFSPLEISAARRAREPACGFFAAVCNSPRAQTRFPSARQCAIVSRKHSHRHPFAMLKVKDTLRSTVNLTFDGRVVKAYHGPDAAGRFANEVRVLRHLDARGCTFVPRLIEADEQQLRIITTNCGSRVEHLDAERTSELFAELEKFGVRHDDPDIRNVTYRQSDGRFCLIDFELATILPATP